MRGGGRNIEFSSGKVCGIRIPTPGFSLFLFTPPPLLTVKFVQFRTLTHNLTS